MTNYLHTINGRPAYFDGDQICYTTYYGKAATLCDSLRQIRKEQKLTQEYRERKGYDLHMDYSYVRVAIHEPTPQEPQ